MSVRTFAAIMVGSYEISMKIFEFLSKGRMREIDSIRQKIELGTDTYATGKISYARVDELCSILLQFREIMKTYKVDDYKAYGTSAIRETENATIILDQIKLRTGIEVSVLSNSEQRFLDYKSAATRGEAFERMIGKGTAIVDIGGGSIQISLFDEDRLVTTQNMRLGVLRIRERLLKLQARPAQYEALIDEMVNAQLEVFQKLHLKGRTIYSITLVDDYVSLIMQRHIKKNDGEDYVRAKDFDVFVGHMKHHNAAETARALDITEEDAFLLFISAVMTSQMLKLMKAEILWAPGVTLTDGMAYEYAEKNKIFVSEHDFEQDIIACAKNISRRYMGSRKRAETLEQICMTIFDSMKKVHGLGRRERLLLRICALLHDCGKYVSLVNVGECSYSIIMSTEIIGLSHREREIVASVVKYNHLAFAYYKEQGRATDLDRDAYLIVAKLAAILRVANGLDRSHKQKFKYIKAALKEDELILTVDTMEDITLERGLFDNKADFFEEVFSIRPVIKQKKTF